MQRMEIKTEYLYNNMVRSLTNWSVNISIPIQFPSFIHTQKRNPRTHLKVSKLMYT